MCQVRTIMCSSDDRPVEFQNFHMLEDPGADSDAKLYCWKHRPCFYLQSQFIMKKPQTLKLYWIVIGNISQWHLHFFLVEHDFFFLGNSVVLGRGHSKSEGCSEGEIAIISNSDFIALTPENSRLLWFTWKWTSIFRPCQRSHVCMYVCISVYTSFEATGCQIHLQFSTKI